jgi:hypothetical protein
MFGFEVGEEGEDGFYVLTSDVDIGMSNMGYTLCSMFYVHPSSLLFSSQHGDV